MDDIAAEAGVSHGLAYRYFANKEQIFSAIVTQALDAPGAALENFAAMQGTTWERLAVLVTGLVDSRRQPETFQLLHQVLVSADTPNELREVLHIRAVLLQNLLRQWIVEGQAQGEVVAGDPDQLVRTILACVEWLDRK